MGHKQKKDKMENATGIVRTTKEEIEQWNQMISLIF